MSVQALIRRAQAAGIELRLVDGKIKAIGAQATVARLLETLRRHRDELIEALTPKQPSAPANWHVLARAYYAHHFKCSTCIAAGQGYGLRCGAGASLWLAYSNVSQLCDCRGKPRST